MLLFCTTASRRTCRNHIELEKIWVIYMYRFRPDYGMYVRPVNEYPEIRTSQSNHVDDSK
jgi:hypothetical protein